MVMTIFSMIIEGVGVGDGSDDATGGDDDAVNGGGYYDDEDVRKTP